MFPNYNYNYNYNYPPQFNSYGSAQNFPSITYNPAQVFHQQYQQQYQQFQGYQAYPQHQQNNSYGGSFLADDPNVVDIGAYVAPSLADPEGKWATKEDIEASYDRGSTVLRQQNNSTIDDYYKQFTRPITEYVPIDIKGQPTYVYQDLGTAAAQKGATGDSVGKSVPSQGSSAHAHKPADAKKSKKASTPPSSNAERATTNNSASEKVAIKEERNTPTNASHTQQAPAARRTSSNSKSESRKQVLPTATHQGSHQQQAPPAQNVFALAAQQPALSPQKLNTQLSQPTASAPKTAPDQHQGARTQIPVHQQPIHNQQQQPQQQQIAAQRQQLPVLQKQAPVQHQQVPVQQQPQQHQQQQIPAQQQRTTVQQQQQINVQRQQIPVQHQQRVPVQQQQHRQEIRVHHQQHQQAKPVQQQIPPSQKAPVHPATQQILGARRISAEQVARDPQPSQPVEQKKSNEQQKQQQPEIKASVTDPKLQGDFHSPQLPMKDENNPVVFFDIVIDDHPRGRLVMELFRHALPETAQNFLFLCGHQQGFGYRLSYFHRIIPGFMAQGGDFEKSDGTGGYSIYGPKFDDEGFPFQHDRPGLLSMANTGPDTNGSQFFITFAPCSHLDGKHVVFGQVLQGFHVLKDLELCGTKEGEVTRAVQIANCDLLQ